MIVDSDHAADNQTRRSSKGFLLYINTALVDWYSKEQANKLETGVIGAEFVAMKMGVDVLRGLRYKLRMRTTYPSLRIPPCPSSL